MNDHDELLGLCALYALGSLDDADMRRLKAHLAEGCAECERELVILREGVSALSASAPSLEPDRALRARILKAIDAESLPIAMVRQFNPSSHRRDPKIVRYMVFSAVGWAAAAMLLLVGLKDQQELKGMREQLVTLRGQMAQLEGRLGDESSWLVSMASPTARVAYFKPTAAGEPKQSGWALFDPENRRAIFVIENLVVEPGHDYELWAIGAEGPRSLGVIKVEPGGRALVRLPAVLNPAGLAAFAVSYEAAGGSPDKKAPAGPVVMVGAL